MHLILHFVHKLLTGEITGDIMPINFISFNKILINVKLLLIEKMQEIRGETCILHQWGV